MTLQRSADYFRDKGVLPAYTSFSDLLREQIDTLSPAIRMSVSDAAAEYHRIVNKAYSGLWDPKTTPYMIEPMNLTDSRKFKGVIFVGPARTGKTKALVECVITKRMICDPCTIHVTQMDRNSARNFSKEKINPMIRHSPELRERLIARGNELGNTFDKQFKGNAYLTIGYPVGQQLASRDIPLTIATDYDKLPDNVDGEGDVWTLQTKRGETFASMAMSVAESSPRKEIQDPDWAPASIHEAPPCGGILGLYNQGTRGRYYWTCPQCSNRFEPDFQHLRWETRQTAKASADTVYMQCPDKTCGGIIEASEKYLLNQQENGAGWLHETNDGHLVQIDDPNVRNTSIASYWLKGLHAAYQNWSGLVEKYLDAMEKYDHTGDEAALRSTTNVDQGHPYLPKRISEATELNANTLIARAEFRELGQVPKGVCFLNVHVDVQPSRFVVSVEGHGKDLESWLVDRFDISVPAQSEDQVDQGLSKRTVQPHLYEEDWIVLEELLDRVWMFEDGKTGLKPRALIVDSQGTAGTTVRAYRFWQKMKRKGFVNRVFLYRGVGGEKKPRAVNRAPENINARKLEKRLAVKVVFASTDRLKDEVAASLVREEAGPLAYHLPSTLARNLFQEYCAEHRIPDKGWEKKRAHFRNESLDLAVMARALLIVIGAEKINWQKPVVWASTGSNNPYRISFGSEVSSNEKTNTQSRGAALARARKNLIKN